MEFSDRLLDYLTLKLMSHELIEMNKYNNLK